MSKYSLTSINSDHQTVVGWDNPMRTFFAQVHSYELEQRAKEGEDIDPIILWKGDQFDQIKTVEVLKSSIAQFTEIPDEIILQLEADQRNTPQPSPLQQQMEELSQRLSWKK